MTAIENKNNPSNYQDLMKTLALIFMLIDHIGLYIFPDHIFFRILGRFSMPIFAFYAGYNFHSKVKHMLWIYGLMIIIVEYMFFDRYIPNILMTLALGQLYLVCLEENLKSNLIFLLYFIILLLSSIMTYDILDTGTLAISFMMVGWLKSRGQEDPGYLLLASLAFAVLNQYIFNFHTIFQFLSALFFLLFASFLLVIMPHETPIQMNLKPIARNMLYIFTITTLLLVTYQYYFI